MNRDYKDTKELVTRLFENIDNKNKPVQMVNAWKEVVSSIYENGPKMADHSRLIDYKNGVLLVETDHSGWTQLLQINSNYILKGLRMKFPQLVIKSLNYRMRGQNIVLHEKPAEKIEKSEENTRIEDEEINKLFESIKNSIKER
ncbi:MAG: DUF721 domain-containing protein [Spirochaetaceae bacterium]|nr:DUF721 domain-containing protein [Spirochaetaceae bacterium]